MIKEPDPRWEARLVPDSSCPKCKVVLDTAGNEKGDIPGPMDITICIQCAQICQYDAKMQLVAFSIKETPEELREELEKMIEIVGRL